MQYNCLLGAVSGGEKLKMGNFQGGTIPDTAESVFGTGADGPDCVSECEIRQTSERASNRERCRTRINLLHKKELQHIAGMGIDASQRVTRLESLMRGAERENSDWVGWLGLCFFW